MPLPPNLAARQVTQAIAFIERKSEEMLALYWEQPNVFSAAVGIFGVLALDSMTAYEKNPNKHVAASRFPDLYLRGAAQPPGPRQSLESKASKRIWAVDSHYNHEGWYIVWRYLVDQTEALGRKVVIWRVDCEYITPEKWRYQGSTAAQDRGGRTHTFNLRGPSTIFTDPVFMHPNVQITRSKPTIVRP